jgi:hypothetical protein
MNNCKNTIPTNVPLSPRRKIFSMCSKRRLLAIALFVVGVHSILLGMFIYFMTEVFYRVFFSSEIVNLFFVRQSGLFLFLAGLFYLIPLTNLERLSPVIVVTIISKICAVFFLFSNAGYTPAPFMVYLAGFGDGCMAIVLSLTYVMFRKEITPKTPS